MGCESNNANATPPSPAIAPGAEGIDPAEVAREFGRRGVDPRLRAVVPAFDAPFFQAGLAGYSDAAMRIVARRHGCPFCVTESLLDRTLLAGGRGFIKADLGDLHLNVPGGPEDHPLACQIMGSDPDEMSAAALKVAEQGRQGGQFYRDRAYPKTGFPLSQARGLRLPGGEQLPPFELCEGCEDEMGQMGHIGQMGQIESARSGEQLAFETIDVNLACPVKKVKSKARGGHWLAEPEGAVEILKAVRAAVPREIPCTVKLRRAYDDTPEMAQRFERVFNAAYELGYAWATVHARTVEQKYVGPSRWGVLRDLVKRHPDRPILGSGDIWNAADIFRMLAYTGVSAAAVARGCIGNPWIFRQARQMMAGEAPTAPTIAEQRAVLEEHFRLCMALNGEKQAGMLMRKFGIRFAEHHPRGEEVRRAFIAVGSIADWEGVLGEFYGSAGGRVESAGACADSCASGVGGEPGAVRAS